MAEYSASIYAKTPEEHAYYLQYYTQYYTTQLQSCKAKSEATAAPDLSKYVFDEKSGYYYDSASNLYYDSNTQYFYNPQTLQFSYWDNEKHTFVAVPSAETKSVPSTADKEEKKEKPEKQDKVTARFNNYIDMLFSGLLDYLYSNWNRSIYFFFSLPHCVNCFCLEKR